MNKYFRKLYNLNLRQIVGKIKSVLAVPAEPVKPKAEERYTDDGKPLAKILYPDYHAWADPLIQSVIEKVRQGVNLDEALKNIPGFEIYERVAEYPYVVNWLNQYSGRPKLLDIGCVLNNKKVANYLREKCSEIWFNNVVIEGRIWIDGPVTYHRSDITKDFPSGLKFDCITCLSTIEHIGFDNSHYGCKDKPRYTEPTTEPLEQVMKRIISLTAPGGQFLISVPYGLRETIIHPQTRKISSQSFDHESIQQTLNKTCGENVTGQFEVYQAFEDSWRKVDPNECNARYAEHVPAAAAVAFINGTVNS